MAFRAIREAAAPGTLERVWASPVPTPVHTWDGGNACAPAGVPVPQRKDAVTMLQRPVRPPCARGPRAGREAVLPHFVVESGPRRVTVQGQEGTSKLPEGNAAELGRFRGLEV